MSEAKSNTFVKALLLAKRDMGKLIKNSKNEFFKSGYADLNAVLDVVEKPCLDNGILLSFGFRVEEDYLTAELLIRHISGGQDLVTMPMPIQKKDAHSLGSLVTYSRRYLLTSYWNLFQADDDGNQAVEPRKLAKNETPAKKPKNKKKVKTPEGMITAEQAKKLVALAGSKGLTKTDLKAFVDVFGGWKSSAEIPADRFDALMEALNKPSEFDDDLVM